MQFVQTLLGNLGPSHLVFLRRQASHALSIFRFLFFRSWPYCCGGREDLEPEAAKAVDGVIPLAMSFEEIPGAG